MEQRNAEELEALIRDNGGIHRQTGPFADKVAALESIRERLNLMSRGRNGPRAKRSRTRTRARDRASTITDCDGQSDRAEVEWGRAKKSN